MKFRVECIEDDRSNRENGYKDEGSVEIESEV